MNPPTVTPSSRGLRQPTSLGASGAASSPPTNSVSTMSRWRPRCEPRCEPPCTAAAAACSAAAAA
eukprot:scaffold101695_cov42-Phaeocystis_antarctica.AAC.2